MRSRPLEKIERCDPSAAVCVESGKVRGGDGGVDKAARDQDYEDIDVALESCGITRGIKDENEFFIN